MTPLNKGNKIKNLKKSSGYDFIFHSPCKEIDGLDLARLGSGPSLLYKMDNKDPHSFNPADFDLFPIFFRRSSVQQSNQPNFFFRPLESCNKQIVDQQKSRKWQLERGRRGRQW